MYTLLHLTAGLNSLEKSGRSQSLESLRVFTLKVYLVIGLKAHGLEKKCKLDMLKVYFLQCLLWLDPFDSGSEPLSHVPFFSGET